MTESLAGFRRNERGSSLVEAAFVSMILILLMAGVADMGRAFYTYIAITNAAQEGARYASHFPYDAHGIRQAVKTESKSSGINISNNQITITPNPNYSTPPPGASIRVEVDYDLPTIVGGILGLSDLHMHRSTVMIVFDEGR